MKFEKPRVLHIANDFPFPPNHGGRMDMWERTLALAELGYDVHLVCTIKEQPSSSDLRHVRSKIAKLDLLRRYGNWTGLLSRRPIQYTSRLNLRNITLAADYHLLLMESEQVSPILDNPRLKAQYSVLRVHNDEADYHKQLEAASRTLFHRLYYAAESRRFRKFSPEIYNSVDRLWFISRDQKENQPSSLAGKSYFLPAAISPPIMLDRPLVSKRVLFLGTLSVLTNQSGIQWYLQNVHPHLLDLPDYQFVIAGNTRGKNLRELLQVWKNCVRVEIHTDVEDIEPLYASASVFVNPMQSGASVKMKTISAAQQGLPVVTTSVGNEGSGLEPNRHLLVADSAENFVAAIRRLLTTNAGRSLVEEARSFLTNSYDHATHLKKLLATL